MGGRGGPLWQRLTYRLPPPSAMQPPASNSAGSKTRSISGALSIEDVRGVTTTVQTAFWEYLEQQLRLWRCGVSAGAAAALPFNFWGGFVGYLGYELKAECGGSNAFSSCTPDAALFRADRCCLARFACIMGLPGEQVLVALPCLLLVML